MDKIAIVNKFSFRWNGTAPPLGHVYKPWTPDYVPLYVCFVPKGSSYETRLVEPEFLTVDFAGLQQPTMAAIENAWRVAADKAFAKRPADMRHYILNVVEGVNGYIDVRLFFDVNPDQMDIIIGGHEYISRRSSSPDWEWTIDQAREVLNRGSEVLPISVGRDVDGRFMFRTPTSADFEKGFEYAAAFAEYGPNQVPVYLFGLRKNHYFMSWEGQAEFLKLTEKRTVEAVLASSVPWPYQSTASEPGVGNFKVTLSAYKLSHGNAFQWRATMKIADSVGSTIIRNPDGTFSGGREGVHARSIEKQIGQLFYYAVELTGDYEVLKHFSREEARIEQATGVTISSSKLITVYWGFSKDGKDHWVYPGFLADTPWQNEISSSRLPLFSDNAYFANCPQLGIPDSVALSSAPSGPWQWITPDSAGSGVQGPGYVPVKTIEATPRPKGVGLISSEAEFWKPTLARSIYDNAVKAPPVVEPQPPVVVPPTDPVVVPVNPDLKGALEAIALLGLKIDNVALALSSLADAGDVMHQNVRGLFSAIDVSVGTSTLLTSALNRSLYTLNSNTAAQADAILSNVTELNGKVLPRQQRLFESAAVAIAANLIK